MVDISIVIAVNKKDSWFCRICVASIRYYYPAIAIYLLKDELNGYFNTHELEKYWDVKLIEYPVKKFGWSAAKIHFYSDPQYKGQHFLVMDADIIFIGRVLDQLYVKKFADDVIISKETTTNPDSKWFRDTYFNYDTVKNFDSSYIFQDYTFNCGQLFCKGGFLSKEIMKLYFDFEKYPAWKRLDIFPLVDQSLFNYLLPKMEQSGQISIGKESYMIWSESDQFKNIHLEDVLKGEMYPKMVHWAGALRVPGLKKMTGTATLQHFENIYYSKIPNSKILIWKRKSGNSIKSYIRKIYFLLKKGKRPNQ